MSDNDMTTATKGPCGCYLLDDDLVPCDEHKSKAEKAYTVLCFTVVGNEIDVRTFEREDEARTAAKGFLDRWGVRGNAYICRGEVERVSP